MRPGRSRWTLLLAALGCAIFLLLRCKENGLGLQIARSRVSVPIPVPRTANSATGDGADGDRPRLLDRDSMIERIAGPLLVLGARSHTDPLRSELSTFPVRHLVYSVSVQTSDVHAVRVPWPRGEAAVPLQFIVDYYDALPARVIFGSSGNWRGALQCSRTTTQPFVVLDASAVPSLRLAWPSGSFLERSMQSPVCAAQFEVSREAIRARPRWQFAKLLHDYAVLSPSADDDADAVALLRCAWPWLFAMGPAVVATEGCSAGAARRTDPVAAPTPMPTLMGRKRGRVIWAVFAGRRPQLSFQSRLWDGLLRSGVDEIHLWDFCMSATGPSIDEKHKNRDWLYTLNSTRAGVVVIDPNSVEKGPLWTDEHGQLNRFAPFYHHYAATLSSDDVLMKVDDDIIDVDLAALSGFIAYRRSSPTLLVVSANVINNGVMAYFQQQAGKKL